MIHMIIKKNDIRRSSKTFSRKTAHLILYHCMSKHSSSIPIHLRGQTTRLYTYSVFENYTINYVLYHFAMSVFSEEAFNIGGVGQRSLEDALGGEGES